MKKKDPVEIVQAFGKAINSGKIENLTELMTEDHTFIDSLGNTVKGRDKMAEGWKGYFSMVPDYKVTFDQVIPKGDLVALFGKAEGTYTKDGKLSEENYWSTPAAWFARILDDKIALW